MTENDDIPVLNALREKLVAGIAEHPSRRWRQPPVAIAAGVVALAVVAGVLLVAKPGGNAHKVVVGQPAGAAAAGTAPAAGPTGTPPPSAVRGASGSWSTTTWTAAGGHTSGGSTTAASPIYPLGGSGTSVAPPTTHPATTVPPSPTSPKAPTTVELTQADFHRSFTVAPGSILDVHLDPSTSAIWPNTPTATNGGVLQLIGSSNTPTSTRAQFRAVAAGSSDLTAYGGPPCSVQPPPTGPPQACPAYASWWTVSITVG